MILPLETRSVDFLASGATLGFFLGDRCVFSSAGRWLHPLFELRTFLSETPVPVAEGVLVDRVIGRAGAFLIASLGMKTVFTPILSQRAIPVLQCHGIQYSFKNQVERIPCGTEDALAGVEDLAEACAWLERRRAKILGTIADSRFMDGPTGTKI